MTFGILCGILVFVLVLYAVFWFSYRFGKTTRKGKENAAFWCFLSGATAFLFAAAILLGALSAPKPSRFVTPTGDVFLSVTTADILNNPVEALLRDSTVEVPLSGHTARVEVQRLESVNGVSAERGVELDVAVGDDPVTNAAIFKAGSLEQFVQQQFDDYGSADAVMEHWRDLAILG